MVIEFGPHEDPVCYSAIPLLPGYSCVMSSPCMDCVFVLDLLLISIFRRPTIDHDQPISLQNSRGHAELYATPSTLPILLAFNALLLDLMVAVFLFSERLSHIIFLLNKH